MNMLTPASATSRLAFGLLSIALGLCLPGSIRAAEPLQRWVYCSQNLWVDSNIDSLETLFARAGKAGYTHVLLSDSKFAKLGEMDAHYFRNIERVKRAAATNHLEIVPALFSIGYSNDLLWHDPNLVEALPVKDALFVVEGGQTHLQPDGAPVLKGGDFADLHQWDWKDATVVSDKGAALIRDPKGENARIVQKVRLTPFRQYHLSVRVKTQDFRGTPEVKILADGQALNWNDLGTKPTQEWTTQHVVFNSLDHTNAHLYLGCWGGQTGSVWWDDAVLQEVGLVNLVRRPGTPFTVKRADGTALIEGKDFEPVADPKMGRRLWAGSYDIYHEPPTLRTALPDGTRLRISYYHAATVHEDQAMICPSEPKTVELLRDQARRMHAAWGAKGYMMSHDEIRVFNWCDACQRRGLDAGALLADNVRTCIGLLNETNPGGRIYVWSDMFDPHHNAHKDYYLVRGDLTGSWAGLTPDVVLLQWNFDHRDESLKWFADRGHRQVIAGYYDAAPEQVRDWLKSADKAGGVLGVMYTTWQANYSDLERFSDLITTPR